MNMGRYTKWRVNLETSEKTLNFHKGCGTICDQSYIKDFCLLYFSLISLVIEPSLLYLKCPHLQQKHVTLLQLKGYYLLDIELLIIFINMKHKDLQVL